MFRNIFRPVRTAVLCDVFLYTQVSFKTNFVWKNKLTVGIIWWFVPLVLL